MKIRRIICLFVALIMVMSMTTVTADAASFKSKPTGVKAKCVSGAAVKVSCKAKKGATGYNFYYSLKKKGKYTLGATSTTRSAVVTGLSAGKKYYFKVQAFKGTTVKTYSKKSKAVKCKTVLKKPSVQVLDKCGCTVSLKLKCQDGTKSFAVYRSTKKKKGFKMIATVNSGAAIAWKDKSVKPSINYYYKVKAVSGKYSTKYSNVVAVRTDVWHRNGNDAVFNPSGSLAKSYRLIGGGKNKLTDRNILFLGSSITYGSASYGVSFADYIKVRNNARVKKLAASRTTMAGPSLSNSYVSRLKNWNAGTYYPDIFVCQLSLNDSLEKNNVPLGTLPDISSLTDKKLAALYKNSNTVGGAIGYITAYAHKKWPYCKVVFFTVRNNGYNSKYASMRSLLYSAKKKYGNIEIIDMWSMSALTNLKGNDFCMYMDDANHPKKAGYLYQWTPEFESKLIQYMPPLYTVSWVSEGETLERDQNVRGGTALSFNGKTPTKKPKTDDKYTYTYKFKGWKNKATGREYSSAAIKKMTVTGNMTFVAVFDVVKTANDQTVQEKSIQSDGPVQSNDPAQPDDPVEIDDPALDDPDNGEGDGGVVDDPVQDSPDETNPDQDDPTLADPSQEDPDQSDQPAPDSNSGDPDGVPGEVLDNALDITGMIIYPSVRFV